MSVEERLKEIKDNIKSYQDYPKTGVLFRDIFSILQQPHLFKILKDVLIETVKTIQPKIDSVVALDARGFLFGPIVALELNIPFVPIRKKGKLPGPVIRQEYEKEYGKDCLEMQENSIEVGQNVLIVDDLLATGGSLLGAHELVKKAGGNVVSSLVIIELEELKGREKIPFKVVSLVKF